MMSDNPIQLGHRIGQMAPYLKAMLEGAELGHPWPALAIEQLGGQDKLRQIVKAPLGPDLDTPEQPMAQFLDLVKRLEDAGNDPFARSRAREELRLWAESWIKAYAELDGRAS